MSYTTENLAELNVLLQFATPSSLDGIKIHKSADQQLIAAASRLFEQGFITQTDGGYLTTLGIETAEHAHLLAGLLNPENTSAA
jgi:uncharacterized protein (TIGR02647 family)